MNRTPRRQAFVLILVLGIVALVAQLAGVGTTSKRVATPSKKLATLAGYAVPDVGSTKLASRTIKVSKGTTIRMKATARVKARKLAAGSTAQVVCGIRYSRDGDASWTLGTPSKSVSLAKKNARAKVTLDRTIAAPANDTYRASVTCHVSSPSSGAHVRGTGMVHLKSGLPAGSAQPTDDSDASSSSGS
jgi:hypothetical protein